MKAIVRWLVLAILAGIYLAAFWALIHPRASRVYQAYFIQRSTTEWKPEHYPSTHQEAILFSRKGLPEWVEFTYGLSNREDDGRWTDGNVAKVAGLVFSQTFHGLLCIELSAAPSAFMRGKTFEIQMGDQTRKVTVDPESLDYKIQLSEVHEADSLSFLFPEKLPRQSQFDPSNGDPRRLGLKLIRLRIVPQSCSGT